MGFRLADIANADMASLVRNMLRSTSTMREEPGGRSGSLPRSESNMQSSHSFNDLSLGTSRDGTALLLQGYTVAIVHDTHGWVAGL